MLTAILQIGLLRKKTIGKAYTESKEGDSLTVLPSAIPKFLTQ